MTCRQLSIDIQGLVQGVGFRPFVYRLAQRFRQTGYVANTNTGVRIVIQGEITEQPLFLQALQTEKPPAALIQRCDIQETAVDCFDRFSIADSSDQGVVSALVPHDQAPCADCLADLQNPASRFYRYPFTSCSACGPRYSILSALPFDRQTTTMASFSLCPACAQDYHNPADRRFHAQTISCPACGPQLQWLSASGQRLASNADSLQAAINALQAGQIIALKGVGGFQLCVDATDQAAVERLRQRKQRWHKPLALMVADLASAQQLCQIDELQARLLTSPQAPIVLLNASRNTAIAKSVAQGSAWLGLMLPASPLHHLLAKAVARPLVITSGNRHHQPLISDDVQAISDLAQVADAFLLHNREITRPLDDAVVRVIAGQATLLRNGRGYAPSLIQTATATEPALAVGGHLHNSIALQVGSTLINSQHIGDLDNAGTQKQLVRTVSDLQGLYRQTATMLIHDLHPDYFSSRWAVQSPGQHHPVQHHYAHILSCMAEHQLRPPLLGFAWDGTGLGDDGHYWGSEALLIHQQGYQRLAHLRPFALLGGDKAAQQPFRSAFVLLSALYGEQINDDYPCLQQIPTEDRLLFQQMLKRKLNCPLTSSAGRLFDAIASLLDICHINHYQGQAAMALEQRADQSDSTSQYPFAISDSVPALIDWQPMICALLADLPQQSTAEIAARFHNTLAAIIVEIARRAGVKSVALSGGCFQNAHLTGKAIKLLSQAGFIVYRHQHIPPNDGGLAVGQLYGHYLNQIVTIR